MLEAKTDEGRTTELMEPRMSSFLLPLKHFYRKLNDRHTRMTELSRLCDGGDKSSIVLARSIRDTVKRRFHRSEKELFEKIENLRDELASSAGSISFTDYGAGEPSDHFSSDEMYRGRLITVSLESLCRHASKSYPWTHLLFKLIRELKPSVCLELGTCLGITGAYQAAALEINQSGKLLTLEGAELLAAVALDNFKRLSLSRATVRVGRFQDILGDVLRQEAPIDFVFIDGHHDGHATIRYFEEILPFLSEGAVLVFDDILWYETMKRAWQQIRGHRQVKTSIDLRVIGLCVITNVSKDKKYFNFRLN